MSKVVGQIAVKVKGRIRGCYSVYQFLIAAITNCHQLIECLLKKMLACSSRDQNWMHFSVGKSSHQGCVSFSHFGRKKNISCLFQYLENSAFLDTESLLPSSTPVTAPQRLLTPPASTLRAFMIIMDQPR